MDKVVKISNSILQYSTNSGVQSNKVKQYEFINLSNVPVLINGIFVDRYFAGARNNPTYLTSFYRWAPIMQPDELDSTNYTWVFQDNWYAAAITPYHNLIVITKE